MSLREIGLSVRGLGSGIFHTLQMPLTPAAYTK